MDQSSPEGPRGRRGARVELFVHIALYLKPSMVSHCQQGEVPDPQDKALHNLVPAFPAVTSSPALPGICVSPNMRWGIRPLYMCIVTLSGYLPFPIPHLKNPDPQSAPSEPTPRLLPESGTVLGFPSPAQLLNLSTTRDWTTHNLILHPESSRKPGV